MVDAIAVLGDGPEDDDPARLLALGLRHLGASVVLGTIVSAPDAPPTTGRLSGTPASEDDLIVLRCPMTSGDDVAGVLALMEDTVGPLHAVVLVSAGAAVTEAGDLAGLDHDQWRRRVEIPLERTLACFQGTYRRLRAGGGCLVVLVPTLSLVGAAGYVPWATVAEGQRSLAKAAGRAWGVEGIRVNCLAVPAALLRPPSTVPVDRPGQPPPSLPAPSALGAEVAPLVASLLSAPWNGVTGATIALDGGVWMTP
jgi:NAD(P)-dependent dehydrogenase (short-subunit alcohol dehydrogenase family)